MISLNLPIGVFDSGVGGLTVAREIISQMPNERIVYLVILPEFLTDQSLRIRLSNIPDRL